MKVPLTLAGFLVACLAGMTPMQATPAPSPAKTKAATTAPPAKPPAAPAKPPTCDDCKDLPRLYRELLEQEFLRKLFESWKRQEYYPRSVEQSAKSELGKAMNGRGQGSLYGAVAPDDAGGGGGAAPAYGTDQSSAACQLVEYYKDEHNEDQTRPTTEAKVRRDNCKAIADFVMAHENHHKEDCKANWKQTKSDSFVTVEYVVQDDIEAYQAGIAVLRDHIAALARNCGWTGSTNAKKPDGTMTVPTPEEISRLKDNTKVKASQLKRRTK